MNKYLKIIGIVSASIVVFLLILSAGFRYAVKTGSLTYWDGKWYTKTQLEKAFPVQYVDTPAKNTPEEVYVAFREALLVGDKEKALGYMTDAHKEDFRQAFFDQEKFDVWIKKLPKEIKKERQDGNFYYYDVDYGTKNKNSATFVKNREGFWQLDSI